ncbi:restriction endonuclease [Prosthecochloris sp. GSB1]|uniref:restriction endonuclease n=1 Tax=Prosthecochloris sp. GSB1 TaxID=281093 RepID=UPI0012374E72|nr:restriction endonuclease [Prosthecochloris sp. GSB1]
MKPKRVDTTNQHKSSKELTDYSNWVTWHWSNSFDSSVPHSSNKKVIPQIEGLQDVFAKGLVYTWNAFSGDIEMPVRFRNCPYCRDYLDERPGAVKMEGDPQFDSRHISIVLNRYVCEGCGWWYVKKFVNDKDCVCQNYSYGTTFYEGIIRYFNVSDIDIPVETLRTHLSKYGDEVHHVNPILFEKLVASIIKDYFVCEVKHVGRSGDGGVDVYAVISDEPCLIQVKRRRDARKAESVSTVRALIGSLVCANSAKGYVITTANDFSKHAKYAANNPNLKRYGIELTLVTKQDLLNMLNVSRDQIVSVWERIEADEKYSY